MRRAFLAILIALAVPTCTAAEEKSLAEHLGALKSKGKQGILSGIYDIDEGDALAHPPILEKLSVHAGHADEQIREAALERLAMSGPQAKAFLAAIEARLTDPVAAVRIKAAYALWKVAAQNAKAAETLVVEMRGVSRGDRYAAFIYLDRMGEAAATSLPEVIQCITERQFDTRAHAIEIAAGLGREHAEQIEPLFLAALEDDFDTVRIAAAQGLFNIDRPTEQAVAALIEVAQREPPPKGSKPKRVFGDEAPQERNQATQAIHALGHLGPDAAAATSTLAKLLTSPNLQVRLSASEALGEIGPAAATAIPALGKALRETETHSVPFVHRAFSVSDNSAKSLAQIGKDSAQVLIEALSDEDMRVRAHAARSLGELPDVAVRSTPKLAAVMNDKHPFVRIETAKALARLGPAAQSATEALVHGLFDDRAFTSFRGGMGIGSTESVQGESLEALLQIKAPPKQAAPAFRHELSQSKTLTYPALFGIRYYATHLQDMKGRLQTRVEREKELETACALAILSPAPQCEDVFVKEFLLKSKDDDKEDSVNPFAAFGLGELALRGVELEPTTVKQLQDWADKDDDLFVLSALLKINPDRASAQRLLAAVRTAHSVFEAMGIREAEHTLTQLASNPEVRATLLEGLDYQGEAGDDDSFFSERQRVFGRLQAVTILWRAGLRSDRLFKSFQQLAAESEGVKGSVADMLADCDEGNRERACAILDSILNEHRLYIVGGDFYGNGGQRRFAGDRAADALVQLRAASVLSARLGDQDPYVRVRVVRALGRLGADGLGPSLLARVNDPQSAVRRELMRSVGRIAVDPRAEREPLRMTLQQGAADRWRSVRDEAARSLKRLSTPATANE